MTGPIKYITGLLFSLRTTIWCLWALIVMLLAGALIMPSKEEFQALHSIPLFVWLKEQPSDITWWLWCSIAVASLLTINTLFCSIESIIKKRKTAQWLLLISPQIIHIGFLFMLFAHLLSSMGGYKDMVVVREGTLLAMRDGSTSLMIRAIDIRVGPNGFITDWAVDVEYFINGTPLHKDRIMPNSPSIKGDLNINVKDLQAFPDKAVLLQVSSEPGAVWALIGGAFFMLGIVTLVVLRIKTSQV